MSTMQPVEDRISTTDRYDEEYFERGAIVGVSGYMNYTWMPEQTLRMAHFLIRDLGLSETGRVLDFGCAKGYLVRALRILDVPAYGVDVSEYAISCVPAEVKAFCRQITDCGDPACFGQEYEWLISKDVFEHLVEADLRVLLTAALPFVRKMFIAVPLGQDDVSGHFVVPEYDRDITHVTVKTRPWWEALFRDCGWTTAAFSYTAKGVKENWTRAWKEGNGFFTLERA